MTIPFRKQVLTMLGERYSDRTLVLCPTVFVKLLGGDHKAAILLSQILYWSDKTKDKDGWFYKSYADWQLETGLSETQVRRIVNGDPRVKAPQRILRELGVETRVRKVKHTGAPTLHYRIHQERFLAALQAFLDPEHCEGSNLTNAGDELPAMPGMNADQSSPTRIPQETPTLEESAEDQPSDPRDEDLAIFLQFQERFGKLKSGNVFALRAELERLGIEKAVLILERCATRGRSWNYVMKALANEATPEVTAQSLTDERCGGFTAFSDETAPNAPEGQCEASMAVSARIEQVVENSGATAAQVWQAAYQQLELQLDRGNFMSYLRDVVLVDFEPENRTFILVPQNVSSRDVLAHRLVRTISRIIGDVVGQPVHVRFVSADEWLKRVA